MLRCVEQLLAAKGNKSIGNHWRSEYPMSKCAHIDFGYHRTVICRIFPETKTFWVDNGGWNTQSTNRAISNYRAALSESFKQINRQQDEI